MKKIKTKNPLRRRLPRQFRSEWPKYLVIFIFLTCMIGFISGVFVANGSMQKAQDSSPAEYLREDGNFTLEKKADEDMLKGIASGKKADVYDYLLNEAYDQIEEQLPDGIPEEMLTPVRDSAREEAEKEVDKAYKELEKDMDLNDPDFRPVPVTIYETFYKEVSEEGGIEINDTPNRVRVYMERSDVNLFSILNGKAPENENEIVIDRNHADNMSIKTGDEITIGGEKFTVSGLVAFSNYSALFSDNTSMMFDAANFDVAMTTKEGFDRIKSHTVYNYAWKWNETPAGKADEQTMTDDFTLVLATHSIVNDVKVKDVLPAYTNNAMTFAPKDFGSDKAMAGVLLYVLIAVLAFIFAVTINNTINREATVIGTLRASGYTRGELARHYAGTPVIITLLAAIFGNVLGYTVFKKLVVFMYYHSYSLPEYETVWSGDAFIYTTVIPLVIMIVINLFIVSLKLRISPLRFIKRDLGSHKDRKAAKLEGLRFLSRFRLRTFRQNLNSYFVLLIGVIFVMILSTFALGMPSTLAHYQEHAEEMMFAQEQVILTQTEDEDGKAITTKTEGAEKFSTTTLTYNYGDREEDIAVYGVLPDSAYVNLTRETSDDEVFISTPFAEKYGLKKGDKVVLENEYESRAYEMTVAGTFDYEAAIAAFMTIDSYNDAFDIEEGEFSGYIADEKITDIDDDYIFAEITAEDISAMARQLDNSVGSFMRYFQVLCLIMAAILLFLLTKLVIERNENSISMTKILGYNTREISSLYLMPTTIAVIISEVIGILLGLYVVKTLWKLILFRMSGYFAFYMPWGDNIKILVMVFIVYLLVMLLDMNRIRRIPKDIALKNVE